MAAIKEVSGQILDKTIEKKIEKISKETSFKKITNLIEYIGNEIAKYDEKHPFTQFPTSKIDSYNKLIQDKIVGIVEVFATKLKMGDFKEKEKLFAEIIEFLANSSVNKALFATEAEKVEVVKIVKSLAKKYDMTITDEQLKTGVNTKGKLKWYSTTPKRMALITGTGALAITGAMLLSGMSENHNTNTTIVPPAYTDEVEKELDAKYQFDITDKENNAEIGYTQVNLINQALQKNKVDEAIILDTLIYFNTNSILDQRFTNEFSNIIGNASPETIRQNYTKYMNAISGKFFESKEERYLSPFASSKVDYEFLKEFEDLRINYNKAETKEAKKEAYNKIYDYVTSFQEKADAEKAFGKGVSDEAMYTITYLMIDMAAHTPGLNEHPAYIKVNNTGKATCTEEEKTTAIEEFEKIYQKETLEDLKNLIDIIRLKGIDETQVSKDEMLELIKKGIITIEVKSVEETTNADGIPQTDSAKVNDANQEIKDSDQPKTEDLIKDGATINTTPNGGKVIVPKENKVTDEDKKKIEEEQKKKDDQKKPTFNDDKTGQVISEDTAKYKTAGIEDGNKDGIDMNDKNYKHNNQTYKDNYDNSYNEAIKSHKTRLDSWVKQSSSNFNEQLKVLPSIVKNAYDVEITNVKNEIKNIENLISSNSLKSADGKLNNLDKTIENLKNDIATDSKGVIKNQTMPEGAIVSDTTPKPTTEKTVVSYAESKISEDTKTNDSKGNDEVTLAPVVETPVTEVKQENKVTITNDDQSAYKEATGNDMTFNFDQSIDVNGNPLDVNVDDFEYVVTFDDAGNPIGMEMVAKVKTR